MLCEDGVLLNGESGSPITSDEPSIDDFEAADEEMPPVGARAILFRILRALGVMLLIVALLLYFVTPFRAVIVDAVRQLRQPLQSIPLAPQERSNPKLPI